MALSELGPRTRHSAACSSSKLQVRLTTSMPLNLELTAPSQTRKVGNAVSKLFCKVVSQRPFVTYTAGGRGERSISGGEGTEPESCL